ncbi:MAG: hypothetical protein R2747_07145 [Pyrinomonadaceae bacterium]
MDLESDLTGKIQKCIDEFVVDPEPFVYKLENPIDVRKLAAKLNVLPILSDFFHQWGLNLNGQVICFPVDDPENSEIIDEEQKHFSNVRRRVYFLASKKYPRLKSMMPERRENAVSCTDCGGRGRHPINDFLGCEMERIVCICGGLGWLPKGENHDAAVNFPK